MIHIILWVIKIQTIYLSIILLVMGEGLKNLEFIRKNMVIWLLLIISVIVNFIFYGININTFLESIIATSLATFL